MGSGWPNTPGLDPCCQGQSGRKDKVQGREGPRGVQEVDLGTSVYHLGACIGYPTGPMSGGLRCAPWVQRGDREMKKRHLPLPSPLLTWKL